MVFDAAFLDVPIQKSGGDVAGVHSELYARLQIAEQRLIKRFPGLSKGQIAGLMGIYKIAGLRPPKKATGGSAPSFHCFGLAIDINHPTNPFVGNKKPTLDANKDKTVTAAGTGEVRRVHAEPLAADHRAGHVPPARRSVRRREGHHGPEGQEQGSRRPGRRTCGTFTTRPLRLSLSTSGSPTISTARD